MYFGYLRHIFIIVFKRNTKNDVLYFIAKSPTRCENGKGGVENYFRCGGIKLALNIQVLKLNRCSSKLSEVKIG